MSMIRFKVAVTSKDVDPDRLQALADEMMGRVEFILGEEFGDPNLPGEPGSNWGADVENYGYDGATITQVGTEQDALRVLPVKE